MSEKIVFMLMFLMFLTVSCGKESKNESSGNKPPLNDSEIIAGNDSTPESEDDSLKDSDNITNPDNDLMLENDEKNNDSDSQEVEVPASFYDINHILDIKIEIKPEDWEKMIEQRYTFASVFSGENCSKPIPELYTYFSGTITVDGEKFENVGIRKKGLIGSHSLVKPSMKIDMAEFNKENNYFGVKKITLNNNKQDPSIIRQCLSYELFAKAGVPAPKCNFAKVTVNGQNLGIYTHVEEISSDFLKLNFDSKKGNLYEGTLADFRTDPLWKSRLEKKNNETENDWSDIEALTKVMEDKNATAESIGNIVAIEPFMKLWIMEMMTGHWDGYTNDTNNFYTYHNPEDNKFHFIPWGTDGTFTFSTQNAGSPKSVFMRGIVARKLYNIPETQKIYFDTLKQIYGTVWQKDEIIKRADEMAKIVSGEVSEAELDFFTKGVEEIKTFATELDKALAAELSANPPPLSEEQTPICFSKQGELATAAETTWGTYPADDPFKTGTGTFELTINGVTQIAVATGAEAGVPPENGKENYTLFMSLGYMTTTDLYILYITVPNSKVKTGTTIDLAQTESYLLLLPGGKLPSQLVSFIESGTITFIEATPEADSKISADIKADIYLGQSVEAPFFF